MTQCLSFLLQFLVMVTILAQDVQLRLSLLSSCIPVLMYLTPLVSWLQCFWTFSWHIFVVLATFVTIVYNLATSLFTCWSWSFFAWLMCYNPCQVGFLIHPDTSLIQFIVTISGRFRFPGMLLKMIHWPTKILNFAFLEWRSVPTVRALQK